MHKQPNIILINCDDLGYGDLGCYGSNKNDTPNIDRLASEGLRCTDFYMASAVCSPSRGAMMTGCYPPRIGFGEFEGKAVLFPGQGVGLNPSEITIAKLLKGVGYKTKLVGKWHCGDQPEFLPTNHGFDEYFGIPYSNDMGRQSNNLDSNCPPLPLMRNDQVLQEQPDQTGLTERYTQECVDFISQQEEDKPFFLYLAHMYVHVPLFVPRQFLNTSRNGAYGGAVNAIDWCTGVLMHELKKQGIDENTLIIFTSDNGSRARDEGGSNLPCAGRKGQTWDGGQRVPCIFHWPGKIEAGSTCEGIISSIDFYPTLAHLGGANIPTDRIIDGLDLSKTLLRGEYSPREVFAYYLMNNLYAIRKGDWKLHLLDPDEWTNKVSVQALYNLNEDVSESNNLYDQNPEIVSELNALANQIREDIGDAACGIRGSNVRAKGKVKNSKTLTQYNSIHPYIIASYDLADSQVMSG